MAMYPGDRAIPHPDGREAADCDTCHGRYGSLQGKNFRIDAREGPRDNSPNGEQAGAL